jgi:hypothetical protein
MARWRPRPTSDFASAGRARVGIRPRACYFFGAWRGRVITIVSRHAGGADWFAPTVIGQIKKLKLQLRQHTK